MSKLITYAYIDGFNSYYRLKKSQHLVKWLDIQKLLYSYISSSQYDVKKIKYFTSRVQFDPNNPGQQTRQNIYLKALQTIPNLEIILGSFKKRRLQGRLCTTDGLTGSRLVEIEKFEEKLSDVNIAVHMVADAYQEKYQCAALMSNDSDLTLPLDHITKSLNKKTIVISPYKTINNSLRQASVLSKTTPTHKKFRQSQFLNPTQSSTGPLYCPKWWVK